MWKMSTSPVLSVYLGGPIEYVEREAAMQWRYDAASYGEKHGLHMVNPFREGGETPHRGKKNGRLIERRDMFLAERTDVLLVDLRDWDKGKGTLIELGWFDAWRRPVFAWAPDNAPARNHPMIEDIVCYWSPDLLPLIDMIAEFKP